MQGRTLLIGLVLLTSIGCAENISPATSDSLVADGVLAQAFDPATTGTIQGRVLWDGDVPASETALVKVNAYHLELHRNPVRYETPHMPKVDARNGGVADAVVFLRGLDLRRCKPWSHDEPRIEFRDRQMSLCQEAQRTNVAFVRRGGRVMTVNHDPDYHALRGRGASFFTLPLIKTEAVSEQKLTRNGLVELFDAAGFYWLHAHLFVDEHPYYARTDEDGIFALAQVPDGAYEIICWMPSWIVTQRERDPESGVVARQVWASPVEQRGKVSVHAGQIVEFAFRWSRTMFEASTEKK